VGAPGEQSRGRFVGQPVRRREDDRILRGRSRFLDDVVAPGAAHMAFVRSPHAHARIAGVRAPAGPLLVLTAADLVGVAAPPRIDAAPGAVLADVPHPLLADGEVRYVGQPVAAVVAETRALAEDAAELVDVAYEPLEAVVDARAGEPLLRFERRVGDVAGAFAAAAHVVRTDRVIPRLTAVPIETRGALAEQADGVLTVWSSSQGSHRPRAQLAQVLGRAEETIRVLVPDVGGAFGSKGTLPVETPLVALAAIRLGRPVKWIEDRRENLLCSPQARGARGAIELALDAEGRILGVRAALLADLGAYLLPNSAIPAHTMAMQIGGCYAIAALAVTVTGARTCKVPVASYRGSGRPEGIYLIETAVDAAARELGIDPVELRRRNLVREFPYRTALGWTYDAGDYERCLDRALALVRPERSRAGATLVGTGVALSVGRSGGLWECADVRVDAAGRVAVAVGSTPSGQGHETTFAQIAADRLGVALADVEVRSGDSAALPDGVGSFASRSTAMGGSAILAAADAVIEAALRHLGPRAEWRDDHFFVGGRELGLRAVAAAAGGLAGSARFTSEQGFSSGAYAAVVAVERATGAVTVRRLAAVDDAGRIVNPLLASAQVAGGTVQGLGAVLTEEVAHDADGRPSAHSLHDYALLTAADVPPLATEFVETPSPLNALGAKGIGDAGAVGAPPAVANALADALGGRRVDPPFTAEKVWLALQEDA
jgi:carbon-monoxide dehydrogenase large subunit